MGFATATLFVQEEAYVYIMGRRQSELDRAVAAIGRKVTAVQGDISHVADVSLIILNVSITTSQAWPGLSVYSATKAAIRSFACTWSAELLDRNIRVNAISAGTIDTPLLDGFGTTEEEIAQAKQLLASRIPMKRIGTPDEVAKAALFLASDDSSSTIGLELFVDGGAVELGSTQLR